MLSDYISPIAFLSTGELAVLPAATEPLTLRPAVDFPATVNAASLHVDRAGWLAAHAHHLTGTAPQFCKPFSLLLDLPSWRCEACSAVWVLDSITGGAHLGVTRHTTGNTCRRSNSRLYKSSAAAMPVNLHQNNIGDRSRGPRAGVLQIFQRRQSGQRRWT